MMNNVSETFLKALSNFLDTAGFIKVQLAVLVFSIVRTKQSKNLLKNNWSHC